MAESDIDQVCDDIATFLAAATGITVAQSYDELTEGIGDTPLLQVYPEEGSTDAFTDTDRLTFGTSTAAPKRVSETVFNCDFYCRRRSNLAQDMKAVVDVQRDAQSKLESIKAKPYFNNSTIKAFKWSWKRTTFLAEGDDRPFVGVRFSITVRQF